MRKFKLSRIILSVTIFFLCSQSTILYGQATSGYIRYEEKVDVHRMLTAQTAGNPQMAAQLASLKNQIDQYTSNMIRLYFNPSESLYKYYFEDRPNSMPGMGGSTMRMTLSMGTNNNQFYTNTDLMISQLDFMGQLYLVSDTIKMAKWKFGEGTRNILGYDCSMAYYTDTTNPDKPLEITAWYTPKIRAFIGPERYNTLPGGILALDINSGERYWVARKIELRDLTAEEKIEPPVESKKTKQITYQEYLNLQLEREKKIKAQSGR